MWRLLRLTTAMTLADLHFAIQGAFGWEHSHMHVFQVSRNEQYAAGAPTGAADELEFQEAEEVTLGELVGRGIKKFTYEYDFGDSWVHEIKVEGVEPLSSPMEIPECIDGARNGPPEDCGGIGGFENFVEAMKDPKHPEHEELKEWYGRSYEPDAFTVEAANAGIRRYLAPKKRPKRTRKPTQPERMR